MSRAADFHVTAGSVMLALAMACAGCGRYGFDPAAASDDGRGTDVPGSPIVFDVASIGTGANTTNLSWTHVVTGSSPVLFVYVATRSVSGAPTVAGLTANNTALVPVARLCPSCSTGGINDFELWYLPAPPTGSVAIAATLSGNAEGAAGVSNSYTGVTAATIDVPATNDALSTTPSLSWTATGAARWAVAGLMDQGGNLMSLVSAGGETMRTDTVCDPNDFVAQSVADQISLSSTTLVFSWTFSTGTYGSGNFCNLNNTSHSWIAVGTSLK